MNRHSIYRLITISIAGVIFGAVAGFLLKSINRKDVTETSSPVRPINGNNEVEPDSASESVEALARSLSSDSLAIEGALLEKLAHWSPRQLKTFAQDLLAKSWPDAHDRKLLRLAFECYAEKNPEEFLRWMIKDPAGDESLASIEIALVQLLHNESSLAGELAGQLPLRVLQSDLLSGAITSFLEQARIDPDVKIPWQFLTTFQLAQADVLARSDPEKALTISENYTSLGAAIFSSAQVFDAWAETDPDAAIAAVEKRLESSSGRILVSALGISGMRDSYPEKITQFLSETVWKDSSLIRVGLNAWIEKDMESALEFAHSSSNPRTRNSALLTAGKLLADSDPARALSFLSEVQSLKNRTELLERTSAAVAIADPAKALSLAGTLDNPYSHAVFMKATVEQWKNSKSSDWLEKLDKDSRRDIENAMQRFPK